MPLCQTIPSQIYLLQYYRPGSLNLKYKSVKINTPFVFRGTFSAVFIGTDYNGWLKSENLLYL